MMHSCISHPKNLPHKLQSSLHGGTKSSPLHMEPLHLSVEVLRLQSELDAHAITQADILWHEAEQRQVGLCHGLSLCANLRWRIPAQ